MMGQFQVLKWGVVFRHHDEYAVSMRQPEDP
jgi:hypothetical protein